MLEKERQCLSGMEGLGSCSFVVVFRTWAAEVSCVDSPEVSLSVRIAALAVSPSLPSLTLELDGTP